ncbi:hypothetical protein Tco_0746452, partial [Tanacetum coccineum]
VDENSWVVINAAAGGNILTKTPRDALTIIKNKSKVRNLQNKPVVSKVSANTSSSTTACPSEMAALTDAVNAMLRYVKTSPSETVKAISEICVTCGGNAYTMCVCRDGNTFKAYGSRTTYNQIQGYVLKETKLSARLSNRFYRVDDPNITIEEYIRLEEEKARKRGKVFNWETAKYGKIWYDEDIHDLRSVETEFPAIAFNDEVSSEKTLSCEPTVSPLNDEIDFRISLDDSDDEDYTVIFDKNSFSYKIFSTNDLKTDSENDNEKVNMPSLPPPEPMVSCFDDLDFFKDFENEFPAIIYNDSQTSKSDLLTEPILSPQHIDKFDDETSFSEYNEEEQNVLYFNDLFPFNIIHPNDDNEVDIIQSLRDMALPPHDQRHQFLRYEGLQYTNGDIVDFNARLARIYRREPETDPRQGDLRDYWIGISSTGDFFGTTPSYTAIRDPILRMCHRYLRLFAAGRKSGALIYGSQFVARLAEHFGLLTEERLRGLSVIFHCIWSIDMTELVRLQICMEIDDTWDWVAQGPERQPDDAAGAHKAAEDAPAVDDDMPQVVPPPPRTQDFSKFATWTVTSLAQMIDRAGVAYTSYSETPREYQRWTGRRIDGANTSTAQQDQQQPDP